MERLEKKCVYASFTMHGLLFIILLITAAFTKPPEVIEIVPVKVFDSRIIDSILNGGGGSPAPATAPKVSSTPPQPVATPPPVAPTPPPPTPKTQAQVVEPPSPLDTKSKRQEETVAVAVRDDGILKASKNKKDSATESKKPKINTTVVTRKRTVEKANDRREEIEAEKAAEHAQQVAQAAHAERMEAFNKTFQGLSQGLTTSGGLTMKDLPGSGGSGPGAANYSQVVLGKFDDAWNPPRDIPLDTAVVRVRVVVHRSGRITEARIIKRSGNALMDRSVQNALDAVKSLPPFPEGATDIERVFPIDFNLQIKRSLG